MLLLHILTNASLYNTDINVHKLLNHRFLDNFKTVVYCIQGPTAAHLMVLLHEEIYWLLEIFQLTSLTFD